MNIKGWADKTFSNEMLCTKILDIGQPSNLKKLKGYRFKIKKITFTTDTFVSLRQHLLEKIQQMINQPLESVQILTPIQLHSTTAQYK